MGHSRHRSGSRHKNVRHRHSHYRADSDRTGTTQLYLQKRRHEKLNDRILYKQQRYFKADSRQIQFKRLYDCLLRNANTTSGWNGILSGHNGHQIETEQWWRTSAFVDAELSGCNGAANWIVRLPLLSQNGNLLLLFRQILPITYRHILPVLSRIHAFFDTNGLEICLPKLLEKLLILVHQDFIQHHRN